MPPARGTRHPPSIIRGRKRGIRRQRWTRPRDVASPTHDAPHRPAASPPRRRAQATAAPIHTVIQRESGWRLVDFKELWQYRDLIWLLAERDLKARYRQSLLGAAWSIVQPLITLAVFLAFFTLLGQTPTASGVPFAVSLLCAIVPWNYFSTVLSTTASSLPANVQLINRSTARGWSSHCRHLRSRSSI